MKKYLIICTVAIGLIPLNIKAQNTESIKTLDSIKNRIIELLEHSSPNFYYLVTESYNGSNKYIQQNRPYYSSLKKPTSVRIVNNSVVLSFKKGERTVSILEKIKQNKEYVAYFVPPAGSGATYGGLIWGNLLILNLTVHGKQQCTKNGK